MSEPGRCQLWYPSDIAALCFSGNIRNDVTRLVLCGSRWPSLAKTSSRQAFLADSNSRCELRTGRLPIVDGRASGTQPEAFCTEPIALAPKWRKKKACSEKSARGIPRGRVSLASWPRTMRENTVVDTAGYDLLALPPIWRVSDSCCGSSKSRSVTVSLTREAASSASNTERKRKRLC